MSGQEIIVGLIGLAVVASIVVRFRRLVRRGGGCDCDGCPHSGSCDKRQQ